MRSALGDLFDRVNDIAPAINGRDRAKLLGQRQFGRVEINADYVRSRRTGDHDG